jgi:hypothetical protein
MDVMELDTDGLVRISVAALASLLATSGGAKLDKNLEIRLDPTTTVLAAVLVERILAATVEVRTREVTVHDVQAELQDAGSKVVIADRCICVGSRGEFGGGGCCVCLLLTTHITKRL